MAESTGVKQKEKHQPGARPARDRVVRKQLVSVRHGATVNELAEDQAQDGGILEQRAAVRRVSGDVVSRALLSAGSRFAHDFSQVRTHTGAPQSNLIVQPELTVNSVEQDVFFKQEVFNLGNPVRQKPIAQELTRVVRQRNTLASPPIQRRTGTASREQQVTSLLASATRLLGAATRHVRLPGIRQLMEQTSRVMSSFSAIDYGIMDSAGRVTRAATRTDLATRVRRRGAVISRPFRFRVSLYLSHETGGPAAGRYTPQGDLGGRIIFFISHIAGQPVQDVAELITHELFHMWAHVQ